MSLFAFLRRRPPKALPAAPPLAREDEVRVHGPPDHPPHSPPAALPAATFADALPPPPEAVGSGVSIYNGRHDDPTATPSRPVPGASFGFDAALAPDVATGDGLATALPVLAWTFGTDAWSPRETAPPSDLLGGTFCFDPEPWHRDVPGGDGAVFALADTFGFAELAPPVGLIPLSSTLAFEPLAVEPLADAPLADAPRAALPRPAALVPTVLPEPTLRPPFRVLLVDDDAATLALVRHRLVREGFEVDDCAEGDDALRRAFDEPGYDLILANTLLAGLDGFGILRHVRAAELPTHVVLMGHQGDEQAIVRAFALGAQDFIPKPFSPIELLARLARVLALPRG